MCKISIIMSVFNTPISMLEKAVFRDNDNNY